MTKQAAKDSKKSAADADQTEEINFEQALEELEILVSQMESGELSLDESLKAFERGVTLTRQCQSALQQAELKVQALTEDGELVDLDSEEIDDA